MNILLLGPYPPPTGGVSRNLVAIRNEIFASGHQCSVIATSKSTRIAAERDVNHPQGILEFLKLLFTLKFDVLHLHIGGDISLKVLGLMFSCAMAGRGRSVITLHSGGYPLSQKGRNASWLSVRGFVFRRFSRLIAVNGTMVEMFERYGVKKDKIRLILPFSHDLPDKTVSIPTDIKDFFAAHKPLLLSTSLLEPEYEIKVQIDAMENVLRAFADAGLVIAGSGSLANELSAYIAAKSYADRIMLAGDVDHKVALNLTDECDVLIRTTRFDGDAISVREALFLDTPVIATDNGMRPVGVDLIPVGDTEGLAARIIEVLGRGKKKITGDRRADHTNLQAVIALYDDLTKT